MKILGVSLFLIFLSLTENDVAGYSIEMKTNLSVQSNDNNEAPEFNLLLNVALGKPDNKPCSKDALPLATQAANSIKNELIIQKCPTDFIKLGSRCYYFSTDDKSWSDALKACHAMDSTLAHPMNSKENSLIANHLRSIKRDTIHKKGYSLGGTDVDEEGKWVWTHDKSPITYTSWDQIQPDNYLGMEDCLEMQYNAQWEWNDYPCSQLKRFVCQRQI